MLSAMDALLESLPGVSCANIREPLINTRNLADLVPHIRSVGNSCGPLPLYPRCCHRSCRSRAARPLFRFNVQVDDVGNTLIFGLTGSGNLTLLSLSAAQFRKHGQVLVLLPTDRSLEQ